MLLLTFFRLLRLKIAFSEHSARAEATRTERDFATPAEKLRSFSELFFKLPNDIKLTHIRIHSLLLPLALHICMRYRSCFNVLDLEYFVASRQ